MLMSSGTNTTGSPIGPNWSKNKLSVAVMSFLCLLLVATGIRFLSLTRSGQQSVERPNPAKNESRSSSAKATDSTRSPAPKRSLDSQAKPAGSIPANSRPGSARSFTRRSHQEKPLTGAAIQARRTAVAEESILVEANPLAPGENPDVASSATEGQPATEPRPNDGSVSSMSFPILEASSKEVNSKTSGAKRARRAEGGQEQIQNRAGVDTSSAKISSGPEVVPIVGPVSQNLDLRMLAYVPPKEEEEEEERLLRHPKLQNQGAVDPVPAVKEPTQPAAMPAPIQSFNGINSASSGCGCLPPDTDGDVGPNHYIQSSNSSIQIFNKTVTSLSGPTTYNSFFSALGVSTPCGNQNRGDGIVLYDHLADRWVVSDFAFPSFPGISFYQCIGVSKTDDPVAGGWWLYAMQVDSATPTFLGDYPKFGLWPDAYYFSVNMFSNNTTFNGVRVFALPRTAMINGTGAPNPGAIAFTLTPTTLGDSYSLLPATFRTGTAPPAGRPEYFLSINSSLTAGTIETQVFAWKFHVDFATPANSTFGVGATHTPNGTITVNGFVDAFTATTSLLVPQNGTAVRLDTIGDRLMAPLVYQNRSGAESLYVAHTVNNNQGGTGPTAIRWYQFDITGNTIPATPVQQQTFNNGADGLWRWMPSIAVDVSGNLSIGYAASSSTLEPGIRYAGRLTGDPLNSLAQGEAQLIAGGGHQTHSAGRWGDYSALSIDPVDQCTFWHTNEYFSATSTASWNTRIGSFKFPSCSIPSFAKVKSFTANSSGDGRVLLNWSSSFEVDNLGYNVYRKVNGRRTRITPQIIGGSALITGPRVALTAGNSYAWADEMIPGARYWLEDIDLEGNSTLTGPITLSSVKAANTAKSQLLSKVGFTQSGLSGQDSIPSEHKAEISPATAAALKPQSDLARGPAVKISVRQEGWYRLPLADMVTAGLDPKADPRNL